MEPQNLTHLLTRLFAALDTDRKGLVTVIELREAAKISSNSEAQRLFTAFQPASDLGLTLNEFCSGLQLTLSSDLVKSLPGVLLLSGFDYPPEMKRSLATAVKHFSRLDEAEDFTAKSIQDLLTESRELFMSGRFEATQDTIKGCLCLLEFLTGVIEYHTDKTERLKLKNIELIEKVENLEKYCKTLEKTKKNLMNQIGTVEREKNKLKEDYNEAEIRMKLSKRQLKEVESRLEEYEKQVTSLVTIIANKDNHFQRIKLELSAVMNDRRSKQDDEENTGDISLHYTSRNSLPLLIENWPMSKTEAQPLPSSDFRYQSLTAQLDQKKEIIRELEHKETSYLSTIKKLQLDLAAFREERKTLYLQLHGLKLINPERLNPRPSIPDTPRITSSLVDELNRLSGNFTEMFINSPLLRPSLAAIYEAEPRPEMQDKAVQMPPGEYHRDCCSIF